jgi:hypothetical protein
MTREIAQKELENTEVFCMWAARTQQPQHVMELAQSRFEAALNTLHNTLEQLAA